MYYKANILKFSHIQLQLLKNCFRLEAAHDNINYKGQQYVDFAQCDIHVMCRGIV